MYCRGRQTTDENIIPENFPHEIESIPFAENFGVPHAQSLFVDILLYCLRTTAWSELHSA